MLKTTQSKLLRYCYNTDIKIKPYN